MACRAETTVLIDNRFVGFGKTRDDALADLLDRIAEEGEARSLDCRTRTCDGDGGGSCQPSVDLEDVENGRMVRYGRAGRFWKAFLFGRNQPGVNAQIPVYCSCAPAAEDDGGVSLRDIPGVPNLASLEIPGRPDRASLSVAATPSLANLTVPASPGLGNLGVPAGSNLANLRPDRIALGIGQLVPGQVCVNGQIIGTARNVPPVTDPDEPTAKEAVRQAALGSAIQDAQSRCNRGTCNSPDEKCTFVKTFEAGSFTSTPGRDPNGNLVWTCAVVSFQVFGVCVCQ